MKKLIIKKNKPVVGVNETEDMNKLTAIKKEKKKNFLISLLFFLFLNDFMIPFLKFEINLVIPLKICTFAKYNSIFLIV